MAKDSGLWTRLRRFESDWGYHFCEKMKGKNRGQYIGIIVIALAVLLALIYFNVGKQPIPYSLDKTFNVITIALIHNGQTTDYYAYIAQNLPQQEQGYMNQTSLGNCNGHSPCVGMLFLFKNTSNYCFWMENTEIPLRQSWISQNGTVVYATDATPYSIQSICSVGIAVLETSPNQSIIAGDKVVVVNST